MSESETSGLRTLIVGIGSSHGDDRVGWLVAQQMREVNAQSQYGVRIATSPADLLDWIDGIERLVICDACHGRGVIGELHRWTWPTDDFTKVEMSGTHNLSLPTVLGLAEKLDNLPSSVVLWAIEGARSQSNDSVSPEVLAAVPRLVSRIVNELHAVQPIERRTCMNNH